MSTVSWRRTIPTLLVATSWLVLGAALLAVGCFNPKIPSGSFRCGTPPNKLCPDGQTCSVTGFCVDSNGADAGGQGGTGGACPNAVTPLCSPMGAVSIPCDPVCQTGCPCGQRCSLTTDAIKCVAQSGTKGSGDPCAPGSNECGPGFACRKETCSSVGRCYRLCHSGPDCGLLPVCGIELNNPAATSAGIKGCNLGEPVPSCDPTSTSTPGGCSIQELGCYLQDQKIMCDCPGSMTSGSPCIFSTNCAPGLTCVSVPGSASGSYVCKPVCKAGATCPDGTSGCMVDSPSLFGHCP